MMDVVYAASNFGIAVGYVFMALVVLPRFKARRWWVPVSAVMFFLTCGLTHTEMAYFALVERHGVVTWWGTLNHIVQVGSVWFFVAGLYLEANDGGIMTREPKDECCPVCGTSERLFDHEDCEAAQQVEPYDPT